MPYPDNHDGDASTSVRVTAAEIRQFVERYEKLDAEKKDIQEAMKEVMAEAKSRGYDPKVLRAVIARRKQDAAERDEFEALLELYMQAIGL